MLLGYLGPRTNSELAAKKYAANIAGLELRSYPAMSEVFEALEAKSIELAMIPVRNSITGDICYKQFAEQRGLSKVDEISIKIQHCLASKTREAKIIASHLEVLKQCSNYLNLNYPILPRIGVESTNEAAKLASLGWGICAIANPETCSRYGLSILERDIVGDNFSTFWILRNRNL